MSGVLDLYQYMSIRTFIRCIAVQGTQTGTDPSGVACSGGIFIADINKAEVLAEARDVHPAYIQTMAVYVNFPTPYWWLAV